MFSFHLISYPDFFEGEVELVNRLLAVHKVFFHLRKPNATAEAYAAFVDQLDVAVCQQVVLHADYHLAQQGRFAACHFSTDKRWLANDNVDFCDLSTSCHTIEELRSLSSVFNSCFLSPVFDSISKQGYQAAFEPCLLRKYLQEERKIKVVALGGIGASTVVQAQLMGFDGAAALGAVWGQNPHYSDDFSGRLEAILKLIG